MEKNDVANVKSGISEEVSREIAAQYAMLSYVVKLISQPPLNSNERFGTNESSGQWVYDMDGLQKWVHHYTERKRLTCPCCKQQANKDSEVRFVCTQCLTEYEYHDEL